MVVVPNTQPLGVLDRIVHSETEVLSDLDRVRIEGGLVKERGVGRGDDKVSVLCGSDGVKSGHWGI